MAGFRFAALAAVFFAVLGLIAPQATQAQDTVRFIVRAFIPKSHPTSSDSILPVPGKPGMFMIPDALPTGLCFDTDHREFSADPAASARLATDITLLLGSPVQVKATSGAAHKAGVTVRRNCLTGGDEKRDTASVDSCSIGAPAVADQLVQVVLQCKAGNPLVPLAPRIDYGGTITYDSGAKTLAFQATIGAFPSFEAYASLNGKPFKKIFALPPADGTSPWALFDGGLGFQSRPLTKTSVSLN